MSNRNFLKYTVISAVLMMLTGCSTLSQDSFSPLGGGSSGVGGGGYPAMGGTGNGLYYEFSDVLVPNDMRVDKNATFITRTPNFAAGVLSVKGKIEISSLITYFSNNMAKDGWALITSFKSPRTVLLFHKDTRWCVINIAERDFNTYADIAVIPGGTASGGGSTVPMMQPNEEPLYR